jgi:glucose-1-phosphate cytidylyltransferase
MKAVILAGGLGTRISEETHLKPKPMIEIGSRPILWHIMKIFSAYDINEFIICCGYKGYVIKEYFANYFLHMSDVTFDMASNQMEVHQKNAEPWRVTLVDTGEETMTGGRLKRVQEYIGNQTFCFTYGDGLSDVNLTKLIQHHQTQGSLATVTAVQPPGRYGSLIMEEDLVLNFSEKPQGDGAWINGGYFVVEPEVLDLITEDSNNWEVDTLPIMADKKRLSAFKHHGFWQAMDTLRDKNFLESMWNSGKAPWKVW